MKRVYRIDNDEKISKLDLIYKMLRLNKNSAIAEFNYSVDKNIDTENKVDLAKGYVSVNIDYKLNGCIPLSEYLKRKILSEQSILDLFINILEVHQISSKLYIDAKELSWNVNDIYINSEGNCIKFLYTPIAYNGRLEDAILLFFKELVYRHINSQDGISVVIKKVMEYIADDCWHAKGLYYQLVELKSTMAISSNHKDDDICEYPVQDEESYEESTSDVFDEINEDIFAPEVLYVGKNINDFKTVMVRILIAVFIGIVLAGIWVSPLENMQKIGIVLIGFALAGIIYKKIILFKKDRNMVTNSDLDEKFPQASPQLFKKSHTKESDKIDRFVLKNFHEKNTDSKAMDSVVAIDKANNNLPNYKTAMMPKSNGMYFLKSVNGDEIHLIKERIIVGRDESSVDICVKNNANVGRQHAELIRIKSGYAIKDLKSINGTYVGNLRVKPTEAIVLMDGDRVKFANTEYIYHNWSA